MLFLNYFILCSSEGGGGDSGNATKFTQFFLFGVQNVGQLQKKQTNKQKRKKERIVSVRL